jgi:glycosyltransferase involved in cell wall biosynthesis
VKLSVLIPVYNEAATVSQVVEQVMDINLNGTLGGIEKEVVIVNDGSTDETPSVLQALADRWPKQVKILHHEKNLGKGTAIRTGLEHVTGDLVITQDADLEYTPQDYPTLLAPFKDPTVQVVYGSRNLRTNPRSTWSFYWGGRLVSWVANLLYGSHISDEATGYKVFCTNLLRSLNLQSTGFEFCPEATAKILRKNVDIHEVPISYQPRSFAEGKKINWYDGIEAIWILLKYRFWRIP